jgi:prepilin-type N-terminal cleavage/methylation domain-containing protein
VRKISIKRAGFTLTELLCVMAIIAILVTLYLGAIGRAFGHVMSLFKGTSN